METERLIEIITKAKQGDSNALQTLYLDIYKSVYYLALRMIKSPEDAEDITQEVYITVQEKIKELREAAAFYGWVNQITVNKCNRFFSKHRDNAKLDDEEIQAIIDDDPMNLPDKALDDEATRKIILDVIDNLPDGQRVCVMLYYYTQFTIAQIAETLETNENTVKSRLSLARAKIRAALEYKAEKEGIKLWGIPLALTPILREAMENMVVPDGAEARMWENVQKAHSEGKQANETPGDTSGQLVPKSGKGGAATTATNMSMTLAGKIIIGVVAAAIIIAGLIFLPKLFNQSDTTPTQSSTDTADIMTETNDTTNQESSETDESGDYSNFSPAVGELLARLVKAVSADERGEASRLLLEIHNLNDESIPQLDRSTPNNVKTSLLEHARIFTEEVNGHWRTHFGGMRIRGQVYVDVMTEPERIWWNIRNSNENGEPDGKVLMQGYDFSGNLIFEEEVDENL